MSVTALETPVARFPSLAAMRSWFSRSFAAEPRYMAAGLIMLAAMVPTFAALALDDRELHGIAIWIKPLKFEFALAAFMLTLGLISPLIDRDVLASRRYRIFSLVAVTMVYLEMLWIAGAAAFGTASHFNQTEPFLEAIYGFMGFAAVTLTSASAVHAWLLARHGAVKLPPALQHGLVLGLALTLPLTLITAGTMSAGGGHWVGGAQSDAGGLAIMGWARDGGDLRVAHFFATHAMHLIPGFALLLTWAGRGNDRNSVSLVAALFVGFVAFTFIQALFGYPFLSLLN